MSATYVTTDAGIFGARQLLGTPNQIVVTENGITAVLSTPQNLNSGASPTFADLTLSGGLVVGYSATPAADEIHVGDGQFGFNFNGGNPLIPFDAFDYWRYTRSSNLWEWLIGGTTEMTLNASGLQITDGLVVGFSGTPAASEIHVGNAQFGLNYNSGTPLLAFDTNDYWRFTRGSNLWEWLIGGMTEMALNASGLQVADGLVVGFSGTPGASEIHVGNAQFGLNYNAGNPLWVSDTNDYVGFTRASNLWEWVIAGTVEMALNASGLQITDGLVVGFSAAPAADQVRVGDGDFALDFGGGDPRLVWGSTNYEQYYRSANGAAHAGEDDHFFVGDAVPTAILNHAHGALGLGGIFYTDVYGLNWSSRSLGHGSKQADQTQQGFLSVVQGKDPAHGGSSVTGKSYHRPSMYVERWDASSVTDHGDESTWGNPKLAPAVLVELMETGSGNIAPCAIAARAYSEVAPGTGEGFFPALNAASFCTQVVSSTTNYQSFVLNLVADWQAGASPINLVGIECDIVPGVASSATGIPGSGGADNFTAYWAQAASDKWCTTGLYISASGNTDDVENDRGFGWRYGQVTDVRCTEWLGYYRNRYETGSGIYVQCTATSLKELFRLCNQPGRDGDGLPTGPIYDRFSVDSDGEVDIYDGWIQGAERSSAPAAPATNGYRVYAVDNGGKTQLMVRFASGAAQQLAIEP